MAPEIGFQEIGAGEPDTKKKVEGVQTHKDHTFFYYLFMLWSAPSKESEYPTFFSNGP